MCHCTETPGVASTDPFQTLAVIWCAYIGLPSQKGHSCSVGDGHHSGYVRDLRGGLYSPDIPAALIGIICSLQGEKAH